MNEFAQQPEPNLVRLAGGAGVERRASSSSSGGGSLPVRRVPRHQPSESPPPRPEHLRAASPREVAAAAAKRAGTRPDAGQANDSIRHPGKGLPQGDTASATPRATPKIRPNSRSTSPQPFTGPSHCSARGARTRRSNTPPLTAEAKKKADKLRNNSASPRVYVRASSPAASTKCSNARREIQQARALAAGVKKKPVEAVSLVRGSHLLQQAQAAAKEQAQLQRKEWMAAVKRTQDSSAKFIAQKRMAASSTNPAASEAHQRAQLIRIAQDDNFWLENIRSFEEAEPQSKTPPKARAQPAMPKSISSAIGPAGDKIIGEFKKMLLARGGNYARAWRYLLDPESRGQLTLPQLAQRCRELGFQENVRTLWYALNGPYGDAAVTLAEVDSETEAVLMRFRAALLARALELGLPKRPKGKEVADIVAESMLRILDLDRSLRLTRHEFCLAAVVQKLAPPAEAPHIFEMLCHGEPGLCTQFHTSANAVVKLDGLKWLYLIAARPDDIPAETAGEKATAKVGIKDEKGRAEKDSDRIHRLRRVWTETPAVFKRLREEQERKVEEMLSHQTQADKDPRPDSPRSAGPGPVHRLLYEDAMRRAARREAEPVVAKPARSHDPEYIDRLAKPTPKEEEEQEVLAKKKPVNIGRELFHARSTVVSVEVASRLDRIMQLANEKRVWHEVRERQRPAASPHLRTASWEESISDSRGVARQEKMEEEVKGFEQAAAQLRDEEVSDDHRCAAMERDACSGNLTFEEPEAKAVAICATDRQRVTEARSHDPAAVISVSGNMACVCPWVLHDEFISIWATCPDGVWQLLALAAGSSKVHLRLAEDHDGLLSVAGGASVGWKDKVRITMTARLKLLVKFKQVEEQWGSGLQELLQDLNPDVPRFGLENLKSGVWLFDAFAFPFRGPRALSAFDGPEFHVNSLEHKQAAAPAAVEPQRLRSSASAALSDESGVSKVPSRRDERTKKGEALLEGPKRHFSRECYHAGNATSKRLRSCLHCDLGDHGSICLEPGLPAYMPPARLEQEAPLCQSAKN
ncbi:unnamed protein product [Symbiodinium sp. CCMP2592]|nr:unnamed protein product [Symbiodinium sp. CCMP2592]